MSTPPLPELRPDVVAGKYDASLFDPTGQTLLINEIFYSIQGEGTNTGRATVFVRLAKCNLACHFCDTEFNTYRREPYRAVVADVVSLTDGNNAARVDLTGGEPLLQNVLPLVGELRGLDYLVGVETSGSVRLPDGLRELLSYVTVSPKVRPDKVPWANLRPTEVKWIVNAAFVAQHPEGPLGTMASWEVGAMPLWALPPHCPHYLQPESNNPKWIAAARKLVQRYPQHYRLSLQTHKFGGFE